MKNKSKFSTIALVLMLAITALVVSLPSVEAADVTTSAFLSVAPNPVGVNQKVQITVWVVPLLPTPYEAFQDFTVTITKPDENIQTLGPVESFAMGAANIEYTPTTVGTYKLKFNYPGQIESTGNHYLPSESPITELIVQQEAVPPLPESPIPNDYWTRPVDSENRGWASITGNWLMLGYNSTYSMGFGDSTSGFNPYTQAPRTAHIMWTKQAALGGLIGGELGSFGYYTGQTYDPYFAPPIILNGMIYYRIGKSGWLGQGYYPGFVCVDLRTGEELWRNEEGFIDLGQITKSTSFNGQGGIPYLWDVTGSTWDAYDPFTGEWAFAFEGAVSGMDYGALWWPDAITFDDEGKMNVFILNGQANWFAKWSQAKAENENGMYLLGQWPDTFDWTLGIEWNVTIPNRQATDPTGNLVGPVKQAVTDNVLIAKVTDGSNWVKYEVAYDMTTGEELWVHDNPVQTWFNIAGEGVYASFNFQERRWTGYNAETGTQLWVSDQAEYPWGTYLNYAPAIAYGKLYFGSFDGNMHAINIETGKEVWKAGGRNNPEIGIGTWPMWAGPIIGGNVVFCGTGEETPTQPLTKGNRIFAFDAENGDEIWSISGYMSLRAIADGYLVGYNGYDNSIYCFGKGPSATTLSAPQTSVPKGTGVMITGTVTDQSTGQKGTAAIADEYMSEWMEYLHMQKSKPTDATGVQVKLQAMSSDGSITDIGTATSDMNGNFGYMWTPQAEGTYQIIATFEGTESYGSSEATTYLGVGPAPTPSEQVSPEAEPGAGLTTTQIAIIAAVIVIAVAGIGAYWIIRRRK